VNRATRRSRTAAKALAPLAAIAALAAAADLTARHGATAGAALIVAVFAACWIVHHARPLLHPARPARTPDPVVPSGNTSPDSRARDMLPVL
jgi:hypothetical protein